MAVDYSIQAEIVDITKETPKAQDVYLVDTNVWYWMVYSNASNSSCNYFSSYPNYLNRAIAKHSTIHFSGFSLAELSHLIEKTEREIYSRSVEGVKAKEYRHNIPEERSRVVEEIQAAWGQVVNLAKPLPITIDASSTNAALTRFQTDKVDGYDIFILESMKKNKVTQVITDDGDFATISNIQGFHFQ